MWASEPSGESLTQTRRLASRIEDGRKIWKLSPMDLKSYSRWYDSSSSKSGSEPPAPRLGARPSHASLVSSS
jgi:hypothetical protein